MNYECWDCGAEYITDGDNDLSVMVTKATGIIVDSDGKVSTYIWCPICRENLNRKGRQW